MATPTVTGDQVLAEAQKFLGDKYVYGASGPSTFDCSGLVEYVYSKLGINLPRTSEEQYSATDRIKESDLQVGDLVFSEMSSGGPGHVGIYVGDAGPQPSAGRSGIARIPYVLEAPHTGDVVKYLPLSEFNAAAYGRVKGGLAASPTPGTSIGSAIGGEISSDISSAFSKFFQIPTQIIDYAKTATDNSTKALGWFSAFFQPNTYVRLGAGFIGTIFLVAGLYTLYLVEGE